MKSLCRLVLVGVFLVQGASAWAAAGLTEDFNDNNLIGWGTGTSYVLTEANQVLRIDADKKNDAWASFTYSFATLDLSSYPRLTVRVKANVNLNLNVSIWDTDSNYVYPTIGGDYTEIVASDDYEVYSFNFSGVTGVKLGQIKMLNFVLNPNTPGCKGTVYFDDLKIGSACQLTPSITEIPTQGHIINTPQKEVFFKGVSDGAGGTTGVTITATSSNTGLIPNPTIDYTAGATTGYLRYTPVANQTGTANIAVTVSAPAAQTTKVLHFDVQVEKNLAPRIDKVANHDAKAGDQRVVELSGIDDGNPNARQAITLTAVSSNTGLIPNPTVNYTSDNRTGTLTYTPTLGQRGTATITATVKDNGGTTAGGVDTNQMSFDVSVYPSLNNPPTIDPIADVSVFKDATEQTVPLTGISDGDGNTTTITVTATSSDTNVIPTPTIVYTSPNPTGQLKFTPVAGKTGTSIITVTVADNGGNANNNGNQAIETMFDIQVRVRPTTGFEDDFNDGIIDPNWLNSGEGCHTVTEEGGALKIVVDKYATGNPWAGLWYPIPNELDMSQHPYISITQKTTNPADMLIFLWDYKNAYNTGGTCQVSVGTNYVEYFMDFTGKNLQGDGTIVDFSRIKALLFNFAPGAMYQGTWYFDDLRVGDKAHRPFVMPTVTMNPVPDYAVAKNCGQQTVQLTGISDGNTGTHTVTVTATSNNTTLIPNPTVSSVVAGNATLTYTPQSDKTGRATITVTGSASGSNNKVITFTVDVLTRDVPSAVGVNVNLSTTYQEIDGLGAFLYDIGVMLPYVQDIGMSMCRLGVIGPDNDDFEPKNDNSDVNIINFDGFNYGAVAMDTIKELKSSSSVEKFILTMWSPPAWMKKNKWLSAQSWASDNILQPYNYAEYGESMVALIKAVKEVTGVDLYAVSLQNEPQFNEPYPSCQIGWNEYRDLVKVAGPRIKEGLTTKLYFPEALHAQGSIDDYIHTLNADPVANQYMDIVAVHNYDTDGIHVGGPGAQGWMDIYSWAQEPPAKKTWMTETSGHDPNWDGAMTLAGNIYTAMYYGKISAWVYWSFDLMLDVAKKPNTLYQVSKQYFKYIRPGAFRADAVSAEPNVLALAFKHTANNTVTIVLTNRGTNSYVVNVTGSGLPSTFTPYSSSNYRNFEQGANVTDGLLLMPPNSLTTLYGQTGPPVPPGQASNPSPANGATSVSTTADLSWTAGSGATSHDVYFGTVSPPPFKVNQTGTTYDTGTMANNTTYYWRIDEKNAGGTTTGVVWSFTTVATAGTGTGLTGDYYDNMDFTAFVLTRTDATVNFDWGSGSPDPTIGADTFSVSWSGQVQPLYSETYTFYTTSDDGVRLWVNGQLIIDNWTDHASTENSGTIALTAGTKYNIDMDYYENGGGAVAKLEWSSTSQARQIVPQTQLYPLAGGPPGQASNPSPANGATGVSITTDLSWTAGSGATSHDVYFGTAATPPFIVNQTGTTYDTGTMSAGTTYYWRIDEKNAGGTTTGVLWSFTTIVAAPGQASSPSPANGATGVSTTADLSWTAGSGATSHDVYFGTVSPGTFQGNQTATTFDTGTMANSTTYYWRIDEKNASGTTTGVVWSFTTASAGGLPSPWLNQDVGSPGVAGSAGYASGTFTVDGDGADIWGTSDQFHFVYQSLSGNGDIVARVPTQENTDGWAKAGVMIRESLTGGSTHAFAAVTPSNGVAFQRRTTTDGSSLHTAGDAVTAPYWVKIARSGSTFTASQSSNGTTWTTIGSETISMATNVYIGLAVTSHNGTTLCTSTFDNVTVTSGGAPPGQASNPSPANGATGVSTTADLSWTAGSGATSHDVYFGTATTPPFIQNQTGTTYDTGTMAYTTTYYWKIDEKNAAGTTTGVVWSFTTAGAVATPTFVAAGAVASGTGTITPALPAGLAVNDILLLSLETANQAISISNQNGGTWAAVTGSPQGTGTAAGSSATRLTVFWSRYNGTQGAPTASDSGNHQLGRIIAVRGATTSGNPWDVTAGGVETTADTSGAIPGATTTVGNTLVVAAIATALPDATGTANFSAWANSNLTSVTERTDNTVTAGNGGGLGIVTGVKATAGAYGNTTVTAGTSAVKGMMSIALKP